MLAGNPKIAFLGLGKMATACLRPLLINKLVTPDRVTGTRSSEKTLAKSRRAFPDINLTTDNIAAAQGADFVFLGVKPQDMGDFNRSLRGHFKKDTVVISMAAGISRAQLQETLQHEPVVRCMPNMPVAISMGMIPYICANSVSEIPGAKQNVQSILNCMGRAHELKKELQIDMATAIAGSTPAYFLLVQEALVDSGVHMGLSRADAELFVAQTMLGTAELVKQSIIQKKDEGLAADSLNNIRNSVVSPGGLTASALYTAEKHAFRYTLSEMVWAAYRRSLEIAAEDDRVHGPGHWEPRAPPYKGASSKKD